MNFTEKYIKMCEQATEIQEGWRLERGDYYIDILAQGITGKNEAGIRTNTFDGGIDSDLRKDVLKSYIFLPRQDQLQEMVFSNEKYIKYVQTHDTSLAFAYANRIANFCWVFEIEDVNELTLLFTMQELYQKKWNNTKEVWE